MKKQHKLVLLIVCLLTNMASLFAKDFDVNKWKYSITKRPIFIYRVDNGNIIETKLLKEKMTVKPGAKLTPVTIRGTSYYQLSIPKITKENNNLTGNDDIYNTEDEEYIWYAKEADLSNGAATKYYEHAEIKPYVEFGLLYLPFKFRPLLDDSSFHKPMDITLEANLGATMNIGFHSNNDIIKAASIPINISIFNDKVNKYNSYDGIDKEESLTGLSFATGLIFNVKDGLQIGGFIGTDLGMGVAGERWVYSGRPWFSFGVGYKFIRPNSTTGNVNR